MAKKKTILNTDDNIYTNKENKKIKNLIKWAVIAPIASLLLGAFAYHTLETTLTPPAVVVMEAAGETILMGAFETPDIAHPAGGMFKIVATEGGERRINISADFHIAHAPDPHIRINGVVIAKVANYEGAQSYPIPNFIMEDIMEVTIWCEIADISLGNGMISAL